MWVRGLKPKRLKRNKKELHVAPHVGAWIETLLNAKSADRLSVAPHVGAWIETPICRKSRMFMMSHPMWVRGLKLKCLDVPKLNRGRTPCGCVD